MAALKDENRYVRSQAAGALGELLKSKNEKELIDEFVTHDLSGYRTAGAQALARQDSITDAILEKVNRLKDKDKRPWVRLGAWEAYELIQKRLANEKAANQFIHRADSLFKINKFWVAENQYQSAFDQLTEIIRIDSLKIARTKFQQARCTAKMKRLVPTLDHLQIALQYKKAWRDTLKAELDQKGNDWAFMKDNWYLNDVLLKNPKSQIEIPISKCQIPNLKASNLLKVLKCQLGHWKLCLGFVCNLGFVYWNLNSNVGWFGH